MIERVENPILKLQGDSNEDKKITISQFSNSKNGRFDPGYLIAGSKVIELGKGWYMREERGAAPDYQKHTHIYHKDGRSWSQNEDGSPHDSGSNSSGTPPKSVLKDLKAQGWDWEQKEKDWLNKIEKGADPTGYYFISYPNGRKVTIAYDTGSLAMSYSPTSQELKDYYFGETFIDLRSGNGNSDTEIPSVILPIPNPAPIPAPAPAPAPIPIF